MRHLPVAVVAALLCCAATLHPVRAATPLGTGFTYQGQLKQSGSPVTGTANLLFSLWDALTGPNQVGSTQTINGVSVTGGLFTVQLNAGGEFGVTAFNGNKRWLEISVNGTPLSPRQELTAAPNALFASNADQLDGLDSTAFLTGVPNPLTLTGTSDLYIIAGNNLSAVNGASGVFGSASAASGQIYGVQGYSASTQGFGVFGVTTSTTGPSRGGFFESASSQGIGVLGLAKATTGDAFGVYGESDSSSGRGVYGLATAATGFTYGMWGYSVSPDGRGVYGLATAATGNNFGVYGQSDSSSGRGVYGLASALTGPNVGVYGQSFSSSGAGVIGFAEAQTGTNVGVFGESESTDGRGVYGVAGITTGTNYGVFGESYSTSGTGVFGITASNSGTTYGVYGRSASTSGYGVYANGNLGASGVKSFRIDHPDDPENKYLLHYSVESPEVLNAYSGKATLDGAGQAVVELPRYFAKINKDPRYTLTAVGAPMPNLHVADEIDEAALSAGAKAGPGKAATPCSFRIAGGAPGKKVSWRVEALRNDKWVQQRGEPIEIEKQGPEKGTYQHPEFYGQPKEKGLNYDAARGRPSPTDVPHPRQP